MSLALFDYQEQMLHELRAGIAKGHNAQVLVAPTGAGKTEMAMALMEAAKSKGTRSAMVLDRIVLCNQTSERLQKYNIAHGVLQSGHWRFRPYEPIQICSAQTLERRGGLKELKLLIIDEAHQTRKATAEFIKNNPDICVVGLTATPFTKGLGKLYTNVVSTVTTEQLVKKNRLVPLKVFIAKEIDMEGAKKVAGEWAADEVSERGIKITGDIVSEWETKCREVFGRKVKTIVFASGVAHANDLAQKFNAAGYNFIPLSYRDDDEFKVEAIKDFSKPDTVIDGLIATDILTKGFDVPDVLCGISARPFSKSLSSHIQQMGRVMRCAKGKEFAMWLDHSGNYLRFREDWDDVYENGVHTLDDGKEKAKKEPTKKEKTDSKCPKCSALWPRGSDSCPCCGMVIKSRSAIHAVPGTMEELATKALSIEQSWFSQLLFIGQKSGYKPGWAYFKFKEKFGHEPSHMKYVAAPATTEVSKWVVSQNIRWNRSRKQAHAVR